MGGPCFAVCPAANFSVGTTHNLPETQPSHLQAGLRSVSGAGVRKGRGPMERPPSSGVPWGLSHLAHCTTPARCPPPPPTSLLCSLLSNTEVITFLAKC